MSPEPEPPRHVDPITWPASALDRLATPPITASTTEHERRVLADELRLVATAARERSGVLYDACESRALIAITELAALADQVWKRADAYEHRTY